MAHCELLQDQIITLLSRTSSRGGPWHVECDLVAFFESQGFDADYIRDTIDNLIEDGQLEFMRNSLVGDDLVGLSDLTSAVPAALAPSGMRMALAGASGA